MNPTPGQDGKVGGRGGKVCDATGIKLVARRQGGVKSIRQRTQWRPTGSKITLKCRYRAWETMIPRGEVYPGRKNTQRSKSGKERMNKRQVQSSGGGGDRVGG